jgi:hypothetical protein
MNHPGLDVLLAQVDGELPPDEASEVARHVELCASCREAVIGIGETADVFAGVLGELDADEPASWRTPQVAGVPGTADQRGRAAMRGDAHVLPLRPPAAAPAGGPGRGGLRWAAGVLLVTGAAASAAILGDRLVSDPAATTGTVATDAVGDVTESNVAVVMVEPLNGRVRVSLTAAGAGSTVHVVLTTGQTASVAVEGAESPHFTAVAGHVQLDLGAATADVRLTLPYGLRSATVTVDGMTIVRVDDDVVTPPDALDTGLRLDAAVEVRLE